MKFYKSFKIRTTLMIAFTGLLLGAIIYFVPLFLRYTKDAIINITSEYTIQISDRVSKAVDNYLTSTQNIVDVLESNTDVRYFFRNDKRDKAEEEVIQRLTSQMSVILEARKDIYNIGIISKDKRLIGNYGNLKLNQNIEIQEQRWYQKTLEAHGKTVISTPHVQNIFQDDYRWVITLSKAIYHPQTRNLEGVIMVDINYKEISSLCNEVNPGKRGYIFIVNNEGEVIYHPRQQLLYAGLNSEEIDSVIKTENQLLSKDRDGYAKIYTKIKSSVTSWHVVGVSFEGDLWGNQRETLIFYMLNLGLVLGIGILVAGYLSYIITNPIYHLGERMTQVTSKELYGEDIELPLNDIKYPDNEIGQLNKSYDKMLGEINRLLKDNAKKQEEKRESEMVALQAQINPHFLYNTLDSIIWMAEEERSEEVIEMTAALAKLLRQSISNKKAEVTIDEEVKYVESYLKIQKMRYQDKIDYEILIDEDIRSQKIIKLVLQPLVENAIYHGLKYKEGKGMIRIVGERKGEFVYLIVRDNGIGMSRQKLETLFVEKNEQGKSSIGAMNVYRRLKLTYGSKFGLSYRSKEGFGTSAFVTIPWMKDDTNEI